MFVVPEWVDFFFLAYALTLLCGVGGWIVQGFEHFETLMQKTLCYLFSTFFEVLQENKIVVRLCCIWNLFGISFACFPFTNHAECKLAVQCSGFHNIYGKAQSCVLLPVKCSFKAFCHFYDKKNWENFGIFFSFVFLVKIWLILLVSQKKNSPDFQY